MSGRSYTHKELAALLGVSETTVKSYRRKFPGCIPVSSYGKPIRFPEEAARVALRIRDLFETGMSVPDVRGRLAEEFDWIEEEKAAPAEGAKKNSRDMAPELSLGVSNMARSLVDMTQKQKTILQRIEGLESLLDDMGLAGGGDGAENAREKRRAEAREREGKLEARLSRLDDNARVLSEAVSDLASRLSAFLGERDKAAKLWGEHGPQTMSEAADLAAAAQSQRSGATIIPLRPEKQSEPPPPACAAPAEPARVFFTLPLVVRTEQGNYVSAGGRSRGRFSINDLKAMLIYGFTPPHHFSLRWESYGQGWWLYLEQEQGGRAVHLLLMELPTNKGGSVAEILKLRQNGESLHPAEICPIIDSFGT